MMRSTICQFAILAIATQAGAGTIYVNSAATGGDNGASWTDAYTSLSTAMTNASAGDELWVAAGTYAGTISLKNGVKIYGGFNGSETAASQSDPANNTTTLSGGGVSRAVVSIEHDSSAVLRGFVVADGFVDVPETGGGMYLKNSAAMFVDCTFTRNRAVTMGGAVAIWGGMPTFVNCRFHGNDGGMGGGAVWNRKNAAPTFVTAPLLGGTGFQPVRTRARSPRHTFLHDLVGRR